MKKNGVAKNYIYNLLYQLLTIFLPLITTPYISRILGAKQIGIYGYTTSIMAYFILFGSLGISMYGQREIAYYQENKEKRSKIFWELIIIRTITLTITTTLFYLIYVKGETYSLYYKILLIQFIANIFDISWFFQGIEQFDKAVIRNLIVKILCLILIFTTIKNYNDLWKYFLIYTLSEFIGNISIWLYIPKYIKKINIKEIKLKKHIIPILILFLPQIAIQIYTVLDKTMIGLLTKNMEEVGYYEQAQKIVRASILVIGALQIVMNSRIANAYSNHDKKEVHKCLEKSFRFVLLLSIPMTLGIISIAKNFVPWYYGNDFNKVTGILTFTSPILIIIGLNGITGIEYLVQVGKQNIFTKSVIIGCLINIICNLLLIPKYKSIGASIASVIAEFIILLYQLKYLKKDFTLLQIFKLAIRNIISAIIMFIIISLLTNYLTISIWNTLLEIIIGTIIYIISLLILKDKFTKDIINQIYTAIKSKLGDKICK